MYSQLLTDTDFGLVKAAITTLKGTATATFRILDLAGLFDPRTLRSEGFHAPTQPDSILY